SLLKMLVMWVSTVRSDRNSLAVICLLLRPPATSWAICQFPAGEDGAQLSLDGRGWPPPRPRCRPAVWVDLWHSGGHDSAAVHVEDDACDPARVVRGEVKGGACDILWCAEPAQWVRLDQRLLLLLRDLLQLVLLGQDHLGRDAVHSHPVRAGLGREVLCEDLHAGFRRRVRDERMGVRPAGRRG